MSQSTGLAREAGVVSRNTTLWALQANSSHRGHANTVIVAGVVRNVGTRRAHLALGRAMCIVRELALVAWEAIAEEACATGGGVGSSRADSADANLTREPCAIIHLLTVTIVPWSASRRVGDLTTSSVDELGSLIQEATATIISAMQQVTVEQVFTISRNEG